LRPLVPQKLKIDRPMSRRSRLQESQCLVCPTCASRIVHPVLPTTDAIDLRCEGCGFVWAMPLPPRARRAARFTSERFNIWRSAVERRRRERR
jgi:uncharacterized Zn finger protein